jgi:hypothetical protein
VVVIHNARIVIILISFKVEVKSVLRIGSAHNNVRTSNVNIAQISNVSNFSEHKSDKTLFHINLEA